MAGVMATGAGRVAVPTSTRVAKESSVRGGLSGSAFGTNSTTVAAALTTSPGWKAAFGALLVNTKMPSEVAGLPSSVPGSLCR